MKFEPKILGFLCNWCSYAGADLAGVGRIQYAPNLRVIRVMCSGRVDPTFVLEALTSGVDGVLIMGCHPGDCHYLEGNYEAEMKVDMLKRLLALIGLAERLRLEWASASEGARFAEIVQDFIDHIRSLGPSPLRREKLDVKKLEYIKAAKRAAEDFRLRALVSRERKLLMSGNMYGEEVKEEEFEKIMEEAIVAEYIRNRIYLLLEKEPTSIKNLSHLLELTTTQVLDHIVILRRRGWLTVERLDDMTPIYTVLKV